jgi:hypothetical protein
MLTIPKECIFRCVVWGIIFILMLAFWSIVGYYVYKSLIY